MIKINLLKTFISAGQDDDFAQDDEKKQVYVGFAKRLVLVLIGPLGLYLYENSQIPEFKNQISQIQVKIADLKQFNDKKKGLAEEIKKFEEDQAKLNTQMNFMKQITNDKINELKLFKYLQDNIPESVWVNKLELKGTELSLSAEGDVDSDINRFIEKLGGATFLVGVSPANQEAKNNSLGKGIKTKTFNIKASFAAGTVPQ